MFLFKAQKKHEDKPILAAQDWLEQHYKSDISMDALAEKVGLGTRTFKRRFKLATNENPINYLQRIRVEQVKAKLEKKRQMQLITLFGLWAMKISVVFDNFSNASQFDA